MMLVYWLCTVLELAVLLRLLQARIAERLPCFTIFVAGVIAQQIQAGQATTMVEYEQILAAWQPIASLLHALAALEAFAWLVLSLPRFRRRGAAMALLFVLVAMLAERLTAPASSTVDAIAVGIASMERFVGITLGVTLLLALIWFGSVPIPDSPRWHAGALTVLSLGSALAWQVTLWQPLFAAILLASAIWLTVVDQGPPWREPVPAVEDLGEQERKWRAAE